MRLLLLLVCAMIASSVFASKDKYYPDEIFDETDRYLRQELNVLTRSTHKKLSYDTARAKMFGNIDLESDGQGHFVFDVYCETKVRKGAGPYKIPNNKQMNVEHVWPQNLFVHGGGSSMRTDLHHLLPTASRANSFRGIYPFGNVAATGGIYSGCGPSNRGGLESDYGDYRVFFEPPDAIKGNIARALFYFAVRYDGKIDEVQEFFLRLWHEVDPVNDKDRERHEKIFKAQKNRNPFIDYPELVDKINNF